MANAIPRICIAMGDPAGISAEVLAKLLARADLMRLAAVCVIGDRRFLAEGEKIAGAKSDVAVVAPSAIEQAAAGKPLFVDLGHLDPATIRPAPGGAEGGAQPPAAPAPAPGGRGGAAGASPLFCVPPPPDPATPRRAKAGEEGGSSPD